ncbi:MAG TPA: hypothetical protein VIF09_20540, partial [Polyangiaceae bacterium]
MLVRRDLGILLGLGSIAAVASQACGSKGGGSFTLDGGGADTGVADVTTVQESGGADSSSSGAGEAGCIICGDGGSSSSSGGQSSP